VNHVRERIEAVVRAQREQKRATDALVESTLLVERLTGDNAAVAGALARLSVNLEQSAQLGSQAVRATAEAVSAVARRGERIAEGSDVILSLTSSLREEAERIRGAVAGFRALPPA
jgi:phage-related tail protein